MKIINGKNSGATLLEGLIAIAIFSIGLLGLAGFQLTAMQQGQQARYRATASYYAERLLSQIQTNPSGISAYLGTACPSDSDGTGGNNFVSWCSSMKSNTDPTQRLPITAATVSNDNGQVTVTISWKSSKDSETSNYKTITNINFMQASTS